MHMSRRRTWRRALGLTAMGCLATLFPTTASAQTNCGDTPAVVGPHLEDVQAEILDKPQPDGSNAIFTAFVAPQDQKDSSSSLVVFPDENNPDHALKLVDDGTGFDRAAGDGIFTGVDFFDFAKFADATNSRVSQAQQNGQKTTLLFDGRQVTGEAELPFIDLSTIVPGRPISVRPIGLASLISVPRSLIITDPGVTHDPTRTYNRCTNTGTPMGKWTFGYLLQEMANQPLTGISPPAFARRWLMHWKFAQGINFWTVPARTAINTIISNWEAASGVPPGGALDLAKAPFRLVAIVNRMDLHGSIGYSSGSAGETRFVFALEDTSCNPLPFLVIVEYGNTQTSCTSIKSLAQQWIALGGMVPGTPAYNSALEVLTEKVAKRNSAPSKPNGSALNQLRTNEIQLGSQWELREYKIFSTGVAPGYLTEDTVKRTPDNSLNGTTTLANCINTHLPTIWPNPPASMTNILTGSFDPLECPSGTPFRGGASTVPFPATTMCFNGPIVGNGAISAANARFEYSSNTCAGCHGGEMQTSSTRFTHIDQFGTLSPFLTGAYSKSDCINTSITRSFNEPFRRQQDLDALANNSCFALTALPTLTSIH